MSKPYPWSPADRRLVQRMRARRERDGTSYARLAAMFGVTAMTAHAACNGKTWRHV